MFFRILTAAILLHCFTACQTGPETTPLAEASLDMTATPRQANQAALSASSLGFFAVDGDPAQPETPAPTAVNIVFKSLDGGLSWQDVSAGLPAGFQPESVFAHGGELLLGSEHGLYRSASPPMMQNWTKKEFFQGGKITGLFQGRDGLYAASFGNGFFKVTPDLENWTPLHGGLTDRTIRQVLETPDGTLFVGCESGVHKSADRGKTWKLVYPKIIFSQLMMVDGALFGVDFEGIVRSTDGGDHWERVVKQPAGWAQIYKLGDRYVALSGDMHARKEVRIEGLTDRRMTSTKGLQPRTGLVEGLAGFTHVFELEQAGGYLFCGHPGGISRSADGGRTWELVFFHAEEFLSLDVVVSGEAVFVVKRQGC